jgi:hypothetical protein
MGKKCRPGRLARFVYATLIGTTLAASTPVLATEGGGTSKALGVDTVMAGVMPPPGMRLTTFLSYYDADKTLDGSGNPRPGISDFSLEVEALTFRFQYVWPDTQLWGADIETRVGFTAYLDSKVHFDVQTPVGKVYRQDKAEGTGDALIGPVMLGWHGATYHQIAGVEAFLPTGSFDKSQLTNLGRGYYSIGPAYLFTWYPTEETEISGSSIYLYNFKNPDTNYQSGQELSFDYGLGYAVAPDWQLGLSGYLYKQITDDLVNGQSVPGGNKGRAVAVGPFVRYHPSKDWGITLKWQWETLVENRTEGNRFFLQFALKLW